MTACLVPQLQEQPLKKPQLQVHGHGPSREQLPRSQ